jgi:hypothetical protein
MRLSAMSLVRAVSATSFLLSATVHASSQQDPELAVDAPFDSTTAIENLKKCIEVSPGEDAKLAQIRRITYEFVPERGEAPADQRVSITRTVRMGSNDISANRIVRAIESRRGGNCETDVKIWSISVRLTAPNRIAASFAARVDLRDCGKFLGVPYKNDIGSAGAHVHMAWRIAEDFTVVQEPTVLTDQWKDTNWFYDLIGFVSFGAISLPSMALDMAHISLAQAGGVFSQTFKHEFQALAAGFNTAQDFVRDINLLNAPVWNFQRVPEQSGLIELGGEEATLQLTERVSILPVFGPPTYRMKKAEIKAIYELRFPRPRIHTVVRGESLWKVAAQYYAEPKMFALIESATGLKRTNIRPGQQLVVPYYTELCEQTNQGRIVRPGDSVWALKQLHPGYKPNRRDFRSGRLDLIYPFETVRLPAATAEKPSSQRVAKKASRKTLKYQHRQADRNQDSHRLAVNASVPTNPPIASPN